MELVEPLEPTGEESALARARLHRHVATFTWTEFGQQVAEGIREGAIYAGLALALVIIYRSSRVINFAQGEMATFTTFVAWSLMEHHGLSFWAAFPIVLAIAFAGGVTIETV